MTHDTRVLLMGIILVGFAVARVGGQVYVKYYSPSWLSPFEDWYSGLVSYRTVFLWQLWFVFVMVWIFLGVAYGIGILGHPAMKVMETPFLYIGYVYFGAMIFRYIFTMWKHPDRRWFKKTVPIWFHLALATYTSLYGGHFQSI